MADILTQEELDALLGEMKEGEGGEAPAEPPAEAPVEAALEASPERALEPRDPARNVDLILELPIRLAAELGRTRMTVHELLQLGQGSVIELERLASDLIDLSLNRKVVARGEAVVVAENFGFRVVEVDSVRERIRKL